MKIMGDTPGENCVIPRKIANYSGLMPCRYHQWPMYKIQALWKADWIQKCSNMVKGRKPCTHLLCIGFCEQHELANHICVMQKPSFSVGWKHWYDVHCSKKKGLLELSLLGQFLTFHKLVKKFGGTIHGHGMTSSLPPVESLPTPAVITSHGPNRKTRSVINTNINTTIENTNDDNLLSMDENKQDDDGDLEILQIEEFDEIATLSGNNSENIRINLSSTFDKNKNKNKNKNKGMIRRSGYIQRPNNNMIDNVLYQHVVRPNPFDVNREYVRPAISDR